MTDAYITSAVTTLPQRVYGLPNQEPLNWLRLSSHFKICCLLHFPPSFAFAGGPPKHAWPRKQVHSSDRGSRPTAATATPARAWESPASASPKTSVVCSQGTISARLLLLPPPPAASAAAAAWWTAVPLTTAAPTATASPDAATAAAAPTGATAAAAPDPVPQEPAEDAGDSAVRHWQVLADLLPHLVHLLQSDVLDHLPPR